MHGCRVREEGSYLYYIQFSQIQKSNLAVIQEKLKLLLKTKIFNRDNTQHDNSANINEQPETRINSSIRTLFKKQTVIP